MTSARLRFEKIRVIGRFREANKQENEEWNIYKDTKYAKSKEIVCSASGPTVKVQSINSESGNPYRFTFDELLWSDANQENVFQSVAAPICHNALNGFNGSVIAFGQTGAGKTHSIIGPERKYKIDETGMVPRAANFFFHAIENSPDVESAELRVSFLEIYKQTLRDLNPKSNNNRSLELKIRNKINGEVFIENLNEMAVTSLTQMLKILNSANANRTKKASALNQSSSRSHLIVIFYLKLRKSIDAGGYKSTSKVTFIDLAGSEKGAKPGSPYKNSDISTLNRVVDCLVKQRKSVPFNDSILTSILKDSLSGNSITSVLLNCSPHICSQSETLNTCEFGNKCKAIKTKVSSNKELTPQQMRAIIKKLQKENISKQSKYSNLSNDEKDRKLQDLQNNINELNQSMEEERKKYNELLSKYEEKEENKIMNESNLSEIENLNKDKENLISELNALHLERRDLAILNVILVDRLNNNYNNNKEEEKDYPNQELITKYADLNLNFLENDKINIIKELEECEFSSEQCGEIYDRILKQMKQFSKTLKSNDKKLSKLKEENNSLSENFESANAELNQLKSEKGIGGGSGDDKKKKKGSKKNKNKDDEKYDEDEDQGNNNNKGNVNINDQEDYLQKLAEGDQELMDEKEEKAWRNYLTDRANQAGFKKGKELLKQRRADAKQRIKKGELDEMPTDEELLEDIRDDFYRLYDVTSGEVKSEKDYKSELNGIYGGVIGNDMNIEEINDELDEQDIDDPYEWNVNEVSKWLDSQNYKKYSSIFKKEGIDGRILLRDLNKNNLKKDLQIKSVHVDKLMRDIIDLRRRSPGYDDYRKSQGIEDEPRNVALNKVNIDDELDVDQDQDIQAYNNNNNNSNNNMNGNIYNGGGDNDNNWDLTEEEKQFGEQFWALDELFNILDIYKSGTLNRTAFKHGLHALQVELNDDEMDRVFEQIDNENKGEINYKQFIQYLQFTDFLPSQSQKYAQDILAALPRVAANRKQYVTRAAMVIKYAVRYNNTKTEINNYLLNKGLTRAEIDAAWKQYRFNGKAIRDIDFKSLIGKKGKLIDMAVQDPENVSPFNDYLLYKLLKRAGTKVGNQSNEFNDLDYLRASGNGSRIISIKCWYEPISQFFNGLQVSYECSNGQVVKGGKNMIRQGQYVEGTMNFKKDEVLLSVTVYFAHFICGVRFETDRNSKLFGSDYGRTSVVLAAPVGTCIMSFYGSIGRLVETLGVYVCVNPNANVNNQNKRPLISGEKAVNLKKLKSKKNAGNQSSNQNLGSNNNNNNNNNDENEGGAVTTKKNKKNKNKKSKKSQEEEEEDYEDEEY